MKAVILAGGLGTRLRPLTEVIPKPLLPIGESNVLEIQIQSLKRSGFEQIYIATNYRAEYVKAFLGDGSKYGVQLFFSQEEVIFALIHHHPSALLTIVVVPLPPIPS